MQFPSAKERRQQRAHWVVVEPARESPAQRLVFSTASADSDHQPSSISSSFLGGDSPRLPTRISTLQLLAFDDFNSRAASMLQGTTSAMLEASEGVLDLVASSSGAVTERYIREARAMQAASASAAVAVASTGEHSTGCSSDANGLSRDPMSAPDSPTELVPTPSPSPGIQFSAPLIPSNGDISINHHELAERHYIKARVQLAREITRRQQAEEVAEDRQLLLNRQVEQLRAAEAELVQLRGLVAEQSVQLNSAKQTENDREQVNSRSKSMIEALEFEAIERRKELEVSYEEADTLRKELARLQGELTLAKLEAVEDREREASNSRELLTEQSASMETMMEELRKLKEQLTSGHQRQQVTTGEVDGLRHEMQRIESERTELKDRIDKLQREHSAECTALQKCLDDTRQELLWTKLQGSEDVERRLLAIKEALDEKTIQEAEQRVRCAVLEQTLRARDKDVADLMHKCSSTDRALLEANTELQKRLTSTAAENDKLRHSVSCLSDSRFSSSRLDDVVELEKSGRMAVLSAAEMVFDGFQDSILAVSANTVGSLRENSATPEGLPLARKCTVPPRGHSAAGSNGRSPTSRVLELPGVSALPAQQEHNFFDTDGESEDSLTSAGNVVALSPSSTARVAVDRPFASFRSYQSDPNQVVNVSSSRLSLSQRTPENHGFQTRDDEAVYWAITHYEGIKVQIANVIAQGRFQQQQNDAEILYREHLLQAMERQMMEMTDGESPPVVHPVSYQVYSEVDEAA